MIFKNGCPGYVLSKKFALELDPDGLTAIEYVESLVTLGAIQTDVEQTDDGTIAFALFKTKPTGQPAEVIFKLPDATFPTLPSLEGEAQLGPFLITRKATDSKPDILPLIIEPKGAFGHGFHPTTAMMLLKLSESTPLDKVLDVGTGTGILSIAALRLGAKEVYACDIAEIALEATRHNADKNGVSDRLEVGGDIPRRVAYFALILANIRSRPLVDLAKEFSLMLRLGGQIYVSGIRFHEIELVEATYQQVGFVLEQRCYADGWWQISFRLQSLTH